MSSGKARDIIYGRRGGGWIDPPRRPAAEPTPAPQPAPSADDATLFAPVAGDDRPEIDAGRRTRRPALDPQVVFAPELIAASRAHDQQCSGRHKAGEECPAVIDPGDIAGVWAGRARMARARQVAGLPLNEVDRAALARLDNQERDQ
jgi:hypothetical protein